MLEFQNGKALLKGPKGAITIPQNDEIAHKLAMLFEGECEGLGPSKAAGKFGFSKQRYHQLLHVLQEKGAAGLLSNKRGPQKPHKKTPEVIRQVVRYLFLDNSLSPDVIAQKLRQTGWQISVRTVERIIQEYGLQKKTPRLST